MNLQEPPDASETELEQLLELYGNSLAGKIWRGSKTTREHGRRQQATKILSTGYNKLDEQLHDGGWPLASTTELGLSQSGIGELRLLTPALRELQKSPQQVGVESPQRPESGAVESPQRSELKSPQRRILKSPQRNIIWIAPPCLPFAPALLKQQIDISQLTIVQTNSIQDTLWAAEQALLAECCAAVFTWTGRCNLSIRELRRLQLAAEKTSTWNVLFRHSDCLKQSSTAGLRMHLQANAYSQLDIHILKQPQGWGGQRCSLSLQPHYENWQRLPANLLPNHNRTQAPATSNAARPEQLNDSSNTDHRQATVTVLTSLAALKVVH